MITVSSHLKGDSDGFIPWGSVDEVSGELDLTKGAIELAVNDEPIIDKRSWDYIFPMWVYLADAVSALCNSGEGAFWFPDQPLQLRLLREDGNLNVVLSGKGVKREAMAGEIEFLEAVRARGLEFFEETCSIFPENRDSIRPILRRLGGGPLRVATRNAHWEERVSQQQAAAIRAAEQACGRRMNPCERDGLIVDIAGRSLIFQELFERATQVLRKGD
ncbi:hypothetical protein [Streptomyces johnsoniae]|uniref:Uncharacterized protein n=1 Tax=Streptomyces johnsoniae TaxID=3075532 RepID=A0ABU2S3Q9_9ACTN|nr:hypothetical protein [Streptomyces sp. DSM 41886]MDT0443433.1 hypothetical protein [Streptomyces sp. DSM 41886]